jgi:hypothetical protein
MRPLESLGPAELAIVEALIEAPLAWQRPGELADLAGLDLDATLDALAGLEDGGWLATWEDWPEGVSVTFTPRAAARLGLRLIELGMNEIPRWATAGTPEPPAPPAFGVFANYRGPVPIDAGLASRDLAPDEALDLAERIELGLALGLHRERRRESRPDRAKAERRAELARERRRRKLKARYNPPNLPKAEAV